MCFTITTTRKGLPWWLNWLKKIHWQCRRPWFDPWVWKIPWRREWLPTPIFLPREFHVRRSLVGYSPWGHKELDTAEQLTVSPPQKHLSWYGVVCVSMLNCFSHVWLFAALWTVAHQAPLSMGFSRQEYWIGLPCPSSRGSSQPRDQT